MDETLIDMFYQLEIVFKRNMPPLFIIALRKSRSDGKYKADVQWRGTIVKSALSITF